MSINPRGIRPTLKTNNKTSVNNYAQYHASIRLSGIHPKLGTNPPIPTFLKIEMSLFEREQIQPEMADGFKVVVTFPFESHSFLV